MGASTSASGPSAELLGIAAARFASLGLLDDAQALLEGFGWDGSVAPRDPSVEIARVHERSLGASHRRATGVHYTPERVASTLAGIVLDAPLGAPRIGDPACGGGAFLLAVADRLLAGGCPVEEILADRLFGADIDPVAVAVADLEIALWAAARTGRIHRVTSGHLVAADALASGPTATWLDRPGRLDVVLGNPPFGSQLRGGAIRSAAQRRALAERFGLGPLGYVDTAALFLVRSVELVGVGGRIALIVPDSLAAARSAAPLRRTLAERADLVDAWIGGGDVGFEAAVSVWAPIFERVAEGGARPRTVRRFDADGHVTDEAHRRPSDPDWAPLVGDAPEFSDFAEFASPGADTPTVHTVATVTAGFRRQFYGLAPFVTDAGDGPSDGFELVTTGAIDPLHHRRDAPTRFAGKTFVRAVVDLEALEARDVVLARWVRALTVPKVLVASQGRVIEAIVDEAGFLVPSTPVVAIVPAADTDVDIWMIAAMLTCPFTSWLLRRRAAGTGLSPSGCRVSADFCGSIPLPSDRRAWRGAAVVAQRAARAAETGDGPGWQAALDEVGARMIEAYGGPGSATASAVPIAGRESAASTWWREQRPPWRGARLLSP